MIRELRLEGERRADVQRYVCTECRKSFSLRRWKRRRYSERFAWEVVRRHVEGRESYRVIAKQVYERTGKKISPTSLQRMVERIGRRCKSAWEMSQELRPRWNGFLLFDEKMCSVRGQQLWFYVAVDRTGDILHCRAVKELTVTEASEFLREVKDLGVKCRGVVTDLDTSLSLAVEGVYSGIPHQYCLKHALGTIEKLIEYRGLASRQGWNRRSLRQQFLRLGDRKGVWVQRAREEFLRSWEQARTLSERYRTLKTLRDACGKVLFAKAERQARERFECLRGSRAYPRREHQKAVAFLRRHWDRLMMYHRVPGLPRTNNLVENVNKQLERRLKTIESFQHRSTANNYMNLLIAYLRHKPYTDCRGTRKHLNGTSRLEAAGVKLPSADWLRNSLKPVQISNR